MCGIAGYIGIKKFYPKKLDINKCLDLMKLRGPDSQDFKKFNFGKYDSLMCASRLSIIDINERSNQPIEDSEGILSFNGEIYNYIELRKKLLNKKIIFKTQSDTEVLLKYLNYYGLKKINEIQGMWSFAYFSKKKNKFFLCRDKFGEKPIFFSLNKNKTFTFGSNINYIRALNKKKFEIDDDKIYDYLKFGFRSIYSGNKTFFKKINFVTPGQIIEIDQNFKINIFNYTKFKKYKPIINNYYTGKKLLKKKIDNIVPRSFRSDVPIAFLLSGGVDSSILAYLGKKNLKKIKFYSLKQKDKYYDESRGINLLKKKFKLKHEFVNIKSNKSNYKIIDDLIKDTGFPLISTTNLAINEICKKVRNDGFKVLISGNGADEIFSGYYAHHLSFLLSIQKNENFEISYENWVKITKPHIRTEALKNINIFKKNYKFRGFNFETNIYEKYFKIIKTEKNFSKKLKDKKKDFFIQHLDNDLFVATLPTQAHTLDNISMHNSIESRMPYLNDHLYNLRNTINKNFLIKKGLAKYILRDAFRHYVPNSVLFNSEKTGFFLPLKETINYKSKKFLNVIFKNNYLKKIVNLNLLKKNILRNKLSQQEQKFVFLLYNAAVFLKFYRK